MRILLTPPSAERCDRLLLGELERAGKPLSRARLKALFREGQVLVNGRPAHASDLLPEGREVEIRLPLEEISGEAAGAKPDPSGCSLSVVYEDDDLFVLHKPSGIPSIPHSPAEVQTAVNAALSRDPGISQVGFKGLEPGIVHRLDTATSGLLVFARHEEEFHRLRAAWKTRSIRKIYRAVSNGTAPLPSFPAPIRLKMAHSAKSSRRMLAFPDGKTPRASEIRGKILMADTILLDCAKQGNCLDFEVEILTGHMHQIRATLASLGWPILGDSVYGGSPSTRLWLHAERLVLPLKSGVRLHLHAAIPQEWPGCIIAPGHLR